MYINQIKDWIKENKLLTLILILALILRLKYLTINQGRWWDEAEYLSMAKHWAMNVPFDVHYVRPVLLPAIAALQYFLGITSELPLRILELIISTAGVYAIYLITKELFNKEIALIATFLHSVFYLNLFYTARILVGLPTTTLWLFTTYFFWKGYIKKQHKYLYAMSITLALAILLRFPAGLLAITIILFLIITNKLKWLKNKQLWYSAIIGFIIMLPYFIWFYIKFKKIPILGAAGYYQSGNQVSAYLNMLPNILDTPLAQFNLLLILLIIGTILLSYKAFQKQNLIKDNKEVIFLLFWFIPTAIYFGRHDFAEDRYIFYLFPLFFIIISYTIFYFYKLIKKFHKTIAIIFIILILACTGYYHINYGDQLIKSKATSYKALIESGEWLKQNTNQTDIIISKATPQHTYYSERKILSPQKPPKLKEQIKQYKPKYFVLTVLEPTAPEIFQWVETNQDKLQPITAWMDEQTQQPILIIFEFKTYNF